MGDKDDDVDDFYVDDKDNGDDDDGVNYDTKSI